MSLLLLGRQGRYNAAFVVFVDIMCCFCVFCYVFICLMCYFVGELSSPMNVEC